MKRYLILTLLSLSILAVWTPASAQTILPEPDKDTLKLQLQMFQGLLSADEAKLGLAQKAIDALSKQIADLQKQLEDAKKPAIPKVADTKTKK